MKRLLLAFACLFALGSAVWAQSLQEVAQKEKARRKKVEAKGGQSFTDRDLTDSGSRIPASSTGAASRGTPSADAEAEEEAATPEADPTQSESYWRDRAAGVNKRIQDLETRLQSPELNANTRGAPAREAAERDLAKARADRQALADEARRKGVPPGWIR